MEEDVYICSWSRSDSGFELWLKSEPQIRARGSTYDEAEEALIEAIYRSGGAIYAVLEFDPPLPAADNIRDFLTPSIVTIWGDERFEQGDPRRSGVFANAKERDAHIAWDDEHFEGGKCSECGFAFGQRTDKKIELSYVRSGYGGGFVSINKCSRYIFSETFLSLLDERERASLQLRDVVRPPRARVAYFELIGPAGPPLVGLKDVRPHAGWVCDTCNYRCFGYRRIGFDLDSFVAHDDLPHPLPGVFTVGQLPDVKLAATSERWAQLVGKKGTRGMLSDRLGVVPSGRVDPAPPLRKLSEPDPELEARRRAYWRAEHLRHEQRMQGIRQQRGQ